MGGGDREERRVRFAVSCRYVFSSGPSALSWRSASTHMPLASQTTKRHPSGHKAHDVHSQRTSIAEVDREQEYSSGVAIYFQCPNLLVQYTTQQLSDPALNFPE